MKRKFMIQSCGVMSNFVGHNPLLGIDGKPASYARKTVAFVDALQHQRAFQERRPDCEFRYELVSVLPEKSSDQDLFFDLTSELAHCNIITTWFLVPGSGISPQYGLDEIQSAHEYYTCSFQLAARCSLAGISTLPAGWKDHVDRALTESKIDEWIEGSCEVFTAALKDCDPECEVMFEALTGKHTWGRGYLELPYFNLPSQVMRMVSELSKGLDGSPDDARINISNVVDWAHLFSTAKTESEAMRLVDDELIPLLRKNLVGQMHLSMPRTRGSSTPKRAIKVNSELVAQTSKYIKWINAGLKRIKARGLKIPPHVWEAFQPVNFAGLLKLPDTGLLPYNGAGHATDFFEAVDSGLRK